MAFDSRKRFVADVMLYLACVLDGNFRVNSQLHKEIRQNGMALIDFLCNIKSVGSQGNISVLINEDIITAFEKSDRTAHTRLGKAHILG